MRKLVVLGSAVVLASIAGASLGTFLRLDLPDVRELETRRPPQMTRVYDRDGRAIATFAAEKRILLRHGEVPDNVRRALLASEDSRFMDHVGVDPRGVLRALWSDLRQRRIAEGASTLTMQLAGSLFLDRSRRTVLRKLQEALLALEIERSYSKQEILRFYCNQVHTGHGLYGVEAAARFYFGKPSSELTVGEAAVIVGLLPRPASYSPLRDLPQATRRRDLVLRRMVTVGYLDPDDAERIAAEPVRLAEQGTPDAAGHWFVEEVRRRVTEQFGSSEVYRGGFSIRTTVDSRLQQAAETAVQAGLRALDKRRGFRPEAVRHLAPGTRPEQWTSPGWSEPVEVGDVTDAVVTEVDSTGARLRVDGRRSALGRDGMLWTGESDPTRLLEVGDIVRVHIRSTTPDGRLEATLEQEPEAEAALIAIDPATGEILAMVGGFDPARSEFNRATQARRQAGSAFKPFVLAAALERGWTLADTLIDEPTVFWDETTGRAYQPENFSRSYGGTMTLRAVVERSVNIPAVKLADRIGYAPVVDVARRLGIESRLRPYPSLALGAFEVTLLELTSAYAALAHRGLAVEPHWIAEVTDASGRAVHRAAPRVREAVSPQIAFVVNRALSGVVLRGTGRSAARLGRTVAGKTGTTDDNTDAWFVGYSPDLVVGVWVGFDDGASLGEHETGSKTALPIWIDFMRTALEGRTHREFAVPPGVSFVSIDAKTGRRASEAVCDGRRLVEVFLRGTEPAEPCSVASHRHVRLPYPFQRYPIDPEGALQIPVNELYRLLEQEADVALTEDGGALEVRQSDGPLRVDLHVLPPSESTAGTPLLTAGPAAPEQPTSWIGTDGRPATVVQYGHVRDGRTAWNARVGREPRR